jgi:hypothetical protein
VGQAAESAAERALANGAERAGSSEAAQGWETEAEPAPTRNEPRSGRECVVEPTSGEERERGSERWNERDRDEPAVARRFERDSAREL